MNFFFDSFDYFVYEDKQKNIEQNFIVYILCFLFIFFFKYRGWLSRGNNHIILKNFLLEVLYSSSIINN